MIPRFDFLIVGAGLAGSVLARELQNAGASVIVIDKRKHKGGNLYTPSVHGITVHKYGAHIVHTSNKTVWAYFNKYAEMQRFVNSPIAVYGNELYNLPINMNTLYKLFDAHTPNEAKKAVERDCIPCANPKNLEDWILATAGKTIYQKLIKGYTEKQWGKTCKELPISIMKRIPIRYTFDNSYYNDVYQGIPKGGYNAFIDRLIGGVPVILGVDYNENKHELQKIAKHVIYTGAVDSLYDDEPWLEYRSLEFTMDTVMLNDAQGVAVRNYTDDQTPYTRTIEHKHFEGGDNKPFTLVSYEIPAEYVLGQNEPYYPIETAENAALYSKLRSRAETDGYTLCGRLAEYKYYDMGETILSALRTSKEIIEKR